MALKRLRFLEDITDDDDFVGLFDSGDEQDVKHGGSKPGKKPNLNRDFKWAMQAFFEIISVKILSIPRSISDDDFACLVNCLTRFSMTLWLPLLI